MESFRKRGVVLTVKEVEDIIREYLWTTQGFNPARIDFNIRAIVNTEYNPIYSTYKLTSVTATEESNEVTPVQD